MKAKLTIKLDRKVIERAKEYASSQKRSLSGMIESYLQTLISKDDTKPNSDIEISSFIKSIRTGVKVPDDLEYKKIYGEYLSEKYS